MEELNQIQTEGETTIDTDAFMEGFNEETPNFEEPTDSEEETIEPTETEDEESTEEVEPTEPTEQVEEVEDDFLTIRYNKEDKKLSKDEAIALSQKGMNYDHIKTKYDELNGQIDRLARLNGMTTQEYMAKLNDLQSQLAISQEIENLKQQYPNAEQELLEEVARKNLNDKYSAMEQEKKAEQENIEKQESSELRHQIEKFEKRYPNVDATQLDEEVYDLMKEGYTLLEAYSIHNEKVLEAKYQKQEKIATQNAKTKAKSFGNTTNVGNETEDAFMSGFYSV